MKQKRRLIGAAFLSALLATTGFAMASNDSSSVNLTHLQMENLEALSTKEGGLTMRCYKNYKPGGTSYMELHCKTCSYRFGYNFNTVSRCR